MLLEQRQRDFAPWVTMGQQGCRAVVAAVPGLTAPNCFLQSQGEAQDTALQWNSFYHVFPKGLWGSWDPLGFMANICLSICFLCLNVKKRNACDIISCSGREHPWEKYRVK